MKWVLFGGSCQGMLLSKHGMCNRVSARGLLGEEGGVEGKTISEWRHKKDRQTDREEIRGRREQK